MNSTSTMLILTLIFGVEATEIVLVNDVSLEAYIELYGIRGGIDTYMAIGTYNVENGLVGALQVKQEAESGTSGAQVKVEKFSEYIFKDGATHGKNVVYENLGYSKADSEYLANLYIEQANAKFVNGEYTLGKLEQYGQRINIEIELNGIGEFAGKTSYLKFGWMINSDGTITLNTPFTGFTR